MNMLKEKIRNGSVRLGIIGLGYVGLPLAVEFGKRFDTAGFDVKESRIAGLRQGIDPTLETAPEALAEAQGKHLTFTMSADGLRERDILIVTVPTPVDQYKQPDLTPLLSACRTAGKVLRPGMIVIFESTVYPGCTEDDCVPVLEAESGLKFNHDFFCGYSPERINPGDKTHSLLNTVKITSGSTPDAAEAVDLLYRSILKNGTYPVSGIKVAEAAKIIENSQRDLNIAFVNELAKIFRLSGIDTHEVLDAAGTKWNFLNFRPGLVGGHCIGVDPYYLTHKAQALGYLPEVILAGRRINDGMGKYAAAEIIKLMIKKNIAILDAEVLQLGITFKENCPDIRNSGAANVAHGLQEFGCEVTVWDPWADPEEVRNTYCLRSVRTIPAGKKYAAIVLTTAHDAFRKIDLAPLRSNCSVVFDVKGILPEDQIDSRL